jgi:hypothetical protein
MLIFTHVYGVGRRYNWKETKSDFEETNITEYVYTDYIHIKQEYTCIMVGVPTVYIGQFQASTS